MVFADELTTIRHFLRDPDANIWADADILAYWNDARLEIATKVGYLEKVNVYKYPPEWTFSYMRDWEWQYLDGDRYQCFMPWQARNFISCYPWEAGYFLTSSSTPDSGYRFSHPWEGHVVGSPADVISCSLHDRYNNMKFLAYDEYEVTPSDHRRIAEHDGFYRTTTGDPVNYWFLDNERNQFILYPRPSSITWDDSGLPHDPTDSYSDTGGINTWSEAAIDDADLGVITLTLDTANNVFAVFEAIPQEVDTVSDTIDFPEFLVKYIRFGALERCFGADTDGFIPSLRDYWNFRKELGVRGIRRFKSMRRQDRDYQLSGGRDTVRSRHPRLPAEYPTM